VRFHFACAQVEQGTFTRSASKFLTSRALKRAPDNDELKKLRNEVVMLLELKTN
jgi:hypothetical protein